MNFIIIEIIELVDLSCKIVSINMFKVLKEKMNIMM